MCMGLAASHVRSLTLRLFRSDAELSNPREKRAGCEPRLRICVDQPRPSGVLGNLEPRTHKDETKP